MPSQIPSLSLSLFAELGGKRGVILLCRHIKWSYFFRVCVCPRPCQFVYVSLCVFEFNRENKFQNLIRLNFTSLASPHLYFPFGFLLSLGSFCNFDHLTDAKCHFHPPPIEFSIYIYSRNHLSKVDSCLKFVCAFWPGCILPNLTTGKGPVKDDAWRMAWFKHWVIGWLFDSLSPNNNGHRKVRERNGNESGPRNKPVFTLSHFLCASRALFSSRS